MEVRYGMISAFLFAFLVVAVIVLLACQGRIDIGNKRDKFTLKELPKLQPEPWIDTAKNFEEVEQDMRKPQIENVQFTPRPYDDQDLDNRIATKQYDLGQNTVKNMAYSVSFNDKNKFRKYFDQELRNQSMREWVSVDQIYTKM